MFSGSGSQTQIRSPSLVAIRSVFSEILWDFQSECVLDFILLQFITLVKSRGFLCFATYVGRLIVTQVLDHSSQRHQCIMRRCTTPAVPSHDSSDHLLCTTLARLCQWFLRGRVRPTPSSCVSELGHSLATALQDSRGISVTGTGRYQKLVTRYQVLSRLYIGKSCCYLTSFYRFASNIEHPHLE